MPSHTKINSHTALDMATT